MSQMTKILVTGASGFLGFRIVDFYREKYDVLAPSHKEMDITNEESVYRYFEKYRPEIVIHCAAQSNVGYCEEHPEETWKINVDGSVNIANAIHKYGGKYILCSSDQVYFGSKMNEAHKETEDIIPMNIYGKQKLSAEKKCLEIHSDVVALRLPWMYDTCTKNVNEHSDFMRVLITKIRENQMLEYPIYDIRGICNVNEIIHNLERTFALPGGVYNYGATNDRNTYETVRCALKKAEIDIDNLIQNKTAFADKHRNISMCMDKIGSYGIYFSETSEAIGECLKMNTTTKK